MPHVRVRGFESRQVLNIPNTADVLVVVEYEDFRGTWPNLFRLSPDGKERWASAPGGADAYTHIDLQGDRVVGTTHYGRTRIIDLASGEVVETD